MSVEPVVPSMRGPYQGENLIGEVTESLHAWIRDGWAHPERPPPRIEEDLSFVPKDREQVIYAYMYRLARNNALLNNKRWRHAKVSLGDPEADDARHFFERPPLYLDLYYVMSVHARFRSEAEKLLGWLLLRLNEATHLVYRPRRYILPDGSEVDSTGAAWTPDNRGEGVIMEKVSIDIVDDMSLGDAVNFYNLHDAPYRPFITYRARCAMEGALIESAPTTVRSTGAVAQEQPSDDGIRPNGRPGGRPRLGRRRKKTPFGPPGHDHRRIDDNDSED